MEKAKKKKSSMSLRLCSLAVGNESLNSLRSILGFVGAFSTICCPVARLASASSNSSSRQSSSKSNKYRVTHDLNVPSMYPYPITVITDELSFKIMLKLENKL